MKLSLSKKITLLSSALILTAVSLPASSANWLWLKNSPIEAFTDGDWAMLKKTGINALENSADGVTALWVNHDSGHSGSITPLNTTDRNGLPCRNTKFFNSANNMTGSAEFVLCKQKDGTWKIAQ